MSTTKRTLRMVQLAILTAIIIVLAVTPFLGYIPVGTIQATTIHIPVIIGAILLGPSAGAFLGGVFGLTSFLNNTLTYKLTSFVFTPVYSAPGEDFGSPWSLVICFVPRILIGVVAGYLYKALKALFKGREKDIISISIAAVMGSLTNTILVMAGIYFFFGSAFAEASGMAFNELLSYIITTVVAVNGVVEALVAGLITVLIVRPLMAFMKRKS